MRSSASRRDRNAGWTSRAAASSRRCWRAASPSGPVVRTVRAGSVNRPRRDGCRVVLARTPSPAGRSRVARRCSACNDGAGSSAMATCHPRRPGFETTQASSVVPPSDTTPATSRATGTCHGLGARAASAAATASTTSTAPQADGTTTTSAATGRSATARRPVGSGTRADHQPRENGAGGTAGRGRDASVTGARARWPAPGPARRPRWHPRARPRGAGRCGAAGWAWRWP